MKTMLRIIAIASVMLGGAILNGNAQLITGTTTVAPAKAAILDVKNILDTDNQTSTAGGLVLPRVKLVSKTTLEPFIATNDPEWNASNKAKTMSDHVGLTIYNLTSNGNLKEGVYVWGGNEWNPLKVSSRYIYLPTFELTWGGSSSSQLVIDLFEVYKNNFSPAASTSHHVNSRDANVFVLPDFDDASSDFYYVVTDYHSAIEVYSITPDGKMYYSRSAAEAANAKPPGNVYVNVVLIRK
ncbi:MAG: hypothetical protein LBB64_04285 [Dysgonamonadaceae bacterium]|jgi:hypothetical protein|nr:hypothetical protein [Dysgonamonadaceae bacterium]